MRTYALNPAVWDIAMYSRNVWGTCMESSTLVGVHLVSSTAFVTLLGYKNW